MRLFISAGEPSGDLHGASLIRSLKERYPDTEVVGFGGDRMAAAGCRILYPLADEPIIGFAAVLGALPKLYRVLGQARETFRREKLDGVVLIDYPGFHWWLAGCARKFGLPVSYFVPPQIWAWATWRVHKMRRLVNQVLCSLPFEQPWYEARNVPAEYIGHPYFDELARQRLDGPFLSAQRARPGQVVALLPGSRMSEINGNWASLQRAAALIHARRPDVRFLVACLKPAHADVVRGKLAGAKLPLEIHHGRTPEILQLAHSCLSVSGSVSLEMLFRGKPAGILYHAARPSWLIAQVLMKCKYITLVNLLADRLIYPEYVYCSECPAEKLAGHVLHWLQDRTAYENVCGELARLRDQVAVPGACGRAADAIGGMLTQRVRTAA